MPDLWKALGDVYGDADPDGPPVVAEPTAVNRVTPNLRPALPLDDDLAAALSAALVNAPAAVGLQPAAPAAPPAPAPAPVPAPAPALAERDEEVAGPIVDPVVGEAQHKVTTWIAEVEQRQAARERGPDLEAALPNGPTWSRSDDDIIPATKGKRRR